MIKLDYSYLSPEVSPAEIAAVQGAVKLAHNMLHEGTGAGNDFLGWLAPAVIMDAAQLAKIKTVTAKLREETDIMVVVGIGGSYLGARTVIEALAPAGGKQVLYAGQTLSADYTAWLLDYLKGKRFCINVVSKSGTTTEPAIAFRLLRDLLISEVGEDIATTRIIASTDPDKGALRTTVQNKGYTDFPIPANVGGRYSVFTAVGMVPMAYAGIDVDALITGAVACAEACKNPDLTVNPAYVYAAARNILLEQGKDIELMANFEPRLHYLAEWWKQLYGESEGKDGKGIFPASVEFTTDLHSMGQWIQDGRRAIFETFINLDGGQPIVHLPSDAENLDELNYLVGTDINKVNYSAFQGTALAHRSGGVPSMTITLAKLDAFNLGELLYFFQKACGISGYLLGVNPFDQEGVEAYKKNMFALLGKKGPEVKAEVTAAVDAAVGVNVVGF